MAKVSVERMATAILKELASVSDEAIDALKVESKRDAENAKNKLQSTSPRLTGSYQKGWRYRVSYESAEDIRVTVFNATDYQLTHLLENGHATANGSGRVAGIEHIAPVEQEIQANLADKVKVRISRGLK